MDGILDRRISRDDVLARFRLTEILERDGVKINAQNKALCPFHNEKSGSFDVNREKQMFYCFGCNKGGTVIDYLAYKGNEQPAEVLKRLISLMSSSDVGTTFGQKALGKVVAYYVYRSATGEELCRKVRYDPKDFRIERKGRAGNWIPGLADVQRVLYNLPEILSAKPEEPIFICYTPDTEVLTLKGWRSIAQPVDSVAQYNAVTRGISFVIPQGRTDLQFDGELICVEGAAISLAVTPEHRCLVKTGDWIAPKVRQAKDLRYALWFPHSGQLTDEAGLGPSVPEARLVAAFQADGLITNQHRIKLGDPTAWHHLGFNLKKERKKERLRQLLQNCGLNWKESSYRSAPKWTQFSIQRKESEWLLSYLDDDSFLWSTLFWPEASRIALLEELGYWDGDFTGKRGIRFFTSDEQSADVVCAVAALTGWSSAKRISIRRERPNCQPEYIVNLVRDCSWRQIGNDPTRQPYCGPVHCLTVPDGFLVIRRNGKVSISGNCEGEKDCDNVSKLGWITTTNIDGAGKWMDGYNEALTGRDVVICPDNDKAGREHLQKVLDSLDGKCKRLRVIAVPEPDKDISDYLVRFGNRETQRDAVLALLDKAIVIVQGASVPIRSMREMEDCYIRSLAAKNVFTFNRWLPSLGRVVESMELGDLVSLVASTSAGKTCWLQNLAFWSAPIPTLLFEMELAVTTTFNRFVAGAMRMTQAEVKRRYQEKNAIDWWANEDKLSAIFCCNEGGLSVKRMEEIVNRAELKMGCRPVLVLIDYVQLLNGEGRSKYEQITSAMEDLKSLALNTNTIVICASQRQRPKDERDVEVGLFSGKESGQIENSCQLHLGAWRDNRERDVLWLRVNKNTKGEVGAMIKCNFDGSRMLITEQVKRSPIPTDI